MKTIIPVFVHTDTTSELDNVDLDFDLKDCEVAEYWFYNIDVLFDYVENGKRYCKIISSGEQFISPLTKEEIDIKYTNHLFN